jgi:hypothetical protein
MGWSCAQTSARQPMVRSCSEGWSGRDRPPRPPLSVKAPSGSAAYAAQTVAKRRECVVEGTADADHGIADRSAEVEYQRGHSHIGRGYSRGKAPSPAVGTERLLLE